MEKGQVSSDDARRHWRDLLDEAQRGETAEITRNGKPVAVLVSVAWYRRVTEYLRVLDSDADPLATHIEIGDFLRDARRAAQDRQVVNHAEGDPRDNDPRGLEIREAPEGES